MPDRSYRARNDPPSRWDHVLAHPGQTVLGVWWVVAGALIVASVLVEGFVPSASVDALHPVAALTLGAMQVAGGALVLWGTVTMHPRLDWAWRALRSGLVGAGLAWAGYAVAVLAIYPRSVIAWGTSLVFTAFAGLSWWASRREEADTRHEMRATGRDA